MISMEFIDILDVSIIEPRFKHPKIFEKFDSLSSDEAFIIHNDHDPKPLYYQLLAERGKIFNWEYLKEGPETWKIKITKIQESQGKETIGEMVAKDYRKAQVFKSLGIDFCCGGKKTLDEVCQRKGLNIKHVNEKLLSMNLQEQNPSLNFDKWELDFLADYIIVTHHQYIKESLPFIIELANKVARVHGERHHELMEVASLFNTIGKNLSLHLMKEENAVFPFIKELVEAKKSGGRASAFSLNDMNIPAQILEMEHEQISEDMGIIRTLTNQFNLPSDACTSYTILYKFLEEFESDLFTHVHLENNLLFPKAIQLEKDLRN